MKGEVCVQQMYNMEWLELACVWNGLDKLDKPLATACLHLVKPYPDTLAHNGGHESIVPLKGLGVDFTVQFAHSDTLLMEVNRQNVQIEDVTLYVCTYMQLHEKHMKKHTCT